MIQKVLVDVDLSELKAHPKFMLLSQSCKYFCSCLDGKLSLQNSACLFVALSSTELMVLTAPFGQDSESCNDVSEATFHVDRVL